MFASIEISFSCLEGASSPARCTGRNLSQRNMPLSQARFPYVGSPARSPLACRQTLLVEPRDARRVRHYHRNIHNRKNTISYSYSIVASVIDRRSASFAMTFSGGVDRASNGAFARSSLDESTSETDAEVVSSLRPAIRCLHALREAPSSFFQCGSDCCYEGSILRKGGQASAEKCSRPALETPKHPGGGR